ncbi:hypothetical protein [Staphylococcus delphini]|uniref:hypothetical protein n=1 Tax=Staphylococcus delphini TaxID=53344 RepID=UPI000BBBB1DD|nr:hypothetical protein [Staphylococcus delphini]PCF54027.1 hypothetical protein B5C03_01815 [Staphylococcus delphini]
MFKLSDKYLIRREFFGGLAIILGGDEYELDELSTEILLFFEHSNDINQLKIFLENAMNLELSLEEIKNLLKGDGHKNFKSQSIHIFLTD